MTLETNVKNHSSMANGHLFLAIGILFGLTILGYLLANAAIDYKQLDRSITVKGLSEREYPANIVIWPIGFMTTANTLEDLYGSVDKNTIKIKRFLIEKGVTEKEISFSSPTINDRLVQQYGQSNKPTFRYSASQTVTVYSHNVMKVRAIMNQLSELGKKGIIFTGNNYRTKVDYLFTQLNEIKPDMIEEATRKAREVADKFASDSNSTLGKIKRASQGQFSIRNRDQSSPHIKKIRVVSTVQYYLSD